MAVSRVVSIRRLSQAVLPPALVTGYQNFLGNNFRREHQTFHDLAVSGQHPHSLVIGCCDSRVAPEEVFGAQPGEIFDIRNVANLVPPHPPHAGLCHHSAWAAIDYAVGTLKVKSIVVLGHANCGGVNAFINAGAAAFKAPSPDDSLSHWLALLGPAASQLGTMPPNSNRVELLAKESIRRTLANLRTSGKISLLEREGKLSVHGAYFGIDDASLMALDQATGAFVQVAAGEHKKAMLAASSFSGL